MIQPLKCLQHVVVVVVIAGFRQREQELVNKKVEYPFDPGHQEESINKYSLFSSCAI